MKTEEVTVYVTDDGKRFYDKEEAEKHEKVLNKTKAYMVHYDPDLNETGIPREVGYVLVVSSWSSSLWVEDWAYSKFGSRVAFVQGVAPCEKWSIKRVDMKDVEQDKILAKIIK